MDDIKVRYVNELGRDLHDFGLWDSTLKKSMRQPFLDNSTDFLDVGIGTSALRSDMYNLLGPNGVSPWLDVTQRGRSNSANVTFHDDRNAEIFSRVSDYINGY
jgi:hypothetical protein